MKLTSTKAGVSDYDGAATLKAQMLNETRTSAFYIARMRLRCIVNSTMHFLVRTLIIQQIA